MYVSHIKSELQDSYPIKLSDDAVEKYVQRYQMMLAARGYGSGEDAMRCDPRLRHQRPCDSDFLFANPARLGLADANPFPEVIS